MSNDPIVPSSNGDAPKANGRAALRVGYFGTCLCILFLAQLLTQNMLTTLYPRVAFVSLAIVYFSLGVTALFIPALQKKLGLKISLVIGASGHVLWMLSVAIGLDWYILGASIVLGFGGALLWIAQGVYMTETADGQDVGKLNGLFWAIFNMCLVLGTLALSTMYLLGYEVDLYKVPLVMTVVGGVGMLMLLGIVVPTPRVQSVIATEPTENTACGAFTDVMQSVWSIIKTSVEPKMLLLWGVIIVQGTTSTFLGGVFPLLVKPSQISNLFLCLGLAKMAASYAAGICYDYLGWQAVILVNLVFSFAGYAGIAMGFYQGEVWMMYVSAAIMGVVEAIYLVLITSTITLLWPVGTDKAFAAFRYVNAMFIAAAYFVAPLMTWQQMAILNLGLTVLTTVLFYVLYLVVLRNRSSDYAPLEGEKTEGTKPDVEAVTITVGSPIMGDS